MKRYTIAVVGALGAVGSEMLRILEQRCFPVVKIVPMGTKEDANHTITFHGEEVPVVEAKEGAFKGMHIALFSAGGGPSEVLAPVAVQEGAIVVDNSSAFRMTEGVPLVIPEINPGALKKHRGIIANPNCSTIQMLMVLKPLHDAFTVDRVVVSTYQAVSGSGQSAIDELNEQTKALNEGRAAEVKFYPHRIAFNALPHIDVFLDNRYTKEEMKMVHETHKILDPHIKVSPTAVRIPVFRGHSESLNISFQKPITFEGVLQALEGMDGVRVLDDPEHHVYPMPIEAEGKDEVFVGRIRLDDTVENGLNLWVVSDNLRKGAALNAVQIAEKLIEMNLV